MRFYVLPPEVRNFIYNFVFPSKPKLACQFDEIQPFRLSILSASKRTFGEALPIFYSGWTFRFPLYIPNFAIDPYLPLLQTADIYEEFFPPSYRPVTPSTATISLQINHV